MKEILIEDITGIELDQNHIVRINEKGSTTKSGMSKGLNSIGKRRRDGRTGKEFAEEIKKAIWKNKKSDSQQTSEDAAMEKLKERFAKGEIDEETFKHKKKY